VNAGGEALPAAAHAARVSVEGRTLTYVAAPGELNVVDVTRFVSPYADGYNVFEDAARLRAGRGCRRQTSRHVVCLAAADALRADLRDGNDMLTSQRVGLPATVLGGDGDDLIETGSAQDTIDGGAGEDTVIGRSGDDTLAGAEGGDLLLGGDGGDELDGQGGDDVAMGQVGDGDVLLGGLGRDLLLGGGGRDTLEGDAGGDALFGGAGVDRLEGGSGDDQLTDIDASAGVVNCGPGEDDVRVRGNVALRGCGGAGQAPATTPVVWPPRQAATAAQVPSGKPKVIVRPRSRGRALYVSLLVADRYYYSVTVRVRFYSRAGRPVGSRTYRATTARNARNVYSPRPPRLAFSASGRCCY
jgi:hypothetical protein